MAHVPKPTAHAVLASDHDKTACGVRVSDKPGRLVAYRPQDITCDICALRTLRSLQLEHPGVRVTRLVEDNVLPAVCWDGRAS